MLDSIMPGDRALFAAEQYNRFAQNTGAAGRCDPALAFDAPQLTQALALWREKANGRQMPSRRDIGARALKAFLPHVILVDVIESGELRRFRIRVMGTAMARLLGDHTGKFLDQAVVSPYRERWCAIINSAVVAGEPLRLVGRVNYRQQDFLAMEAMMAPVGPRDDGAEAVLFIAYTTYSAPHVFDPLVKNTVSASSVRRDQISEPT
jgi:hypothetical protein